MRNFRLLLLAGVALFIAFKTLPARAADLVLDANAQTLWSRLMTDAQAMQR